MVQVVYSEAVARVYRAPVCSLSFCFSLAALFGAVVIPFFVAYSSSNFWLKTNTYWEQPLVKFKYDIVMVMQGTTGGTQDLQTWAWATRPAVREAYGEFLRAPVVRAWAADHNKDGSPDEWHLTVQMPLEASDRVHQVQALVFFDYSLQGAAALDMDGMAYVEHSSPLAGTDLLVDAEARLHQRRPLSVRRGNAHPDLRFGQDTHASMADHLVRSYVAAYAQRNYTMTLGNTYKVWGASRALDSFAETAESFSFNMTLRVPSNEVLYTPDLAEVLKVAWVQYFSFFAVFYLLFVLLKRFVFTNQVLETIVSTEGQTKHSRTVKAHRF